MGAPGRYGVRLETDIEAPWGYDATGTTRRTDRVVHEIETQSYSDRLSGLPGNDDLGELSSWDVWAAMGLCPDVPRPVGFSVRSLLFPRIDLQVRGGGTLRILARVPSTSTPYVTGLWLNGPPFGARLPPLNHLGRRTTLTFELSSRPDPHSGRLRTVFVLTPHWVLHDSIVPCQCSPVRRQHRVQHIVDGDDPEYPVILVDHGQRHEVEVG